MEPSTNRRRRIAAALILTSLLVLVPGIRAGAGTTAVPSWRCDYKWRRSTWQVKKLIRCAANRWAVPGGPEKALSVAQCESRFNPSAYGGDGTAGVFQQKLNYWPGRAVAYGFPDWSVFNGRANIIVSIRMAHRYGWSPWGCG